MNYLQGATTTIVGKDFQLAVNDATGRLKRCVGKGQVLLLELPLLHVSAGEAGAAPAARRRELASRQTRRAKRGRQRSAVDRRPLHEFRGRLSNHRDAGRAN